VRLALGLVEGQTLGVLRSPRAYFQQVAILEECFPGEKIDNDWMKAKLQELGMPPKGSKIERLTRLFEFIYSEEGELYFSLGDYEIDDVDSEHNGDELTLAESDDDCSKHGSGSDPDDSSSNDVSPNLVQILDNPNEELNADNTLGFDLNNMTVAQLRDKSRQLGLKGWGGLRKQALKEVLQCELHKQVYFAALERTDE
jgi:hypothetical protein